MRERHAEAHAFGPQPVREGHELRLAVARDDESVDFEPLVEPLDDRVARRRFGERCVEVPLEVVDGSEQEHPALTRRVRRLEHGRNAHVRQRLPPLVQRPDRRELRLCNSCFGQAPAHRDLVRHPVRSLAADPRQPELLGDRRDDRNGAIRGDGDDAVHRMRPSDLDEPRRGQLRHHALVRLGEARRICVRVCCHHADSELSRACDRTPLVPAGSDEQHRLHPGNLTS